MQIAIEAGGFSPARPTAAPRHGDLQAQRHDRQLPETDDRGMVAKGYPQDFAERCFKQIEGFRRIRLSRKPRRLLRAARLRLLLVQDLLSRCLLRGDPEFPADGVLCAGATGARRAGSWRRDPRRRRQSFRLGLPAGGSALRSAAASLDAMPECAASSGRATRVRLGFRQIKGLSEERMKSFVERRGDGYRFGARCLAALRPRCRRDRMPGAGRRLPLARP